MIITEQCGIDTRCQFSMKESSTTVEGCSLLRGAVAFHLLHRGLHVREDKAWALKPNRVLPMMATMTATVAMTAPTCNSSGMAAHRTRAVAPIWGSNDLHRAVAALFVVQESQTNPPSQFMRETLNDVEDHRSHRIKNDQ